MRATYELVAPYVSYIYILDGNVSYIMLSKQPTNGFFRPEPYTVGIEVDLTIHIHYAFLQWYDI